MKTYKTKGLPYFVTSCDNIFNALTVFIQNRIGVTENDVEEFNGIIPIGATIFHYIKRNKNTSKASSF